MDLTVLLINIPRNTNDVLLRTLFQSPVQLMFSSSQHQTLEESGLEATQVSRAYKIGIIRNPYERLVAYYQHLIQRAQQRIRLRSLLSPDGDLSEVSDQEIKDLLVQEVYQDPAYLEFLGVWKIGKIIRHLRQYREADPMVVAYLKRLGFSNWLRQVLSGEEFPDLVQPQMNLAHQFVTTSQESYLKWHGRQRINALFRYEDLAGEFKLLTEHLQIPPLDPKDYPVVDYQSHYDEEVLAQVTPYLQTDLDKFGYRF